MRAGSRSEGRNPIGTSFLLYGQPILLIDQHSTRCSAPDEGLVSGNNFTSYALHIGQLVHMLAGRWVKVAVDAVHLVVHVMSLVIVATFVV